LEDIIWLHICNSLVQYLVMVGSKIRSTKSEIRNKYKMFKIPTPQTERV
jgi:hypothetical protein